MPDERTVPLTEMTSLDPDTLHLVRRGANGFPPLLEKSVRDEIEAAKSDSAEIDEIESDMTGEGAKATEDGEAEKGKKIRQVTTWPAPKAKKGEAEEQMAEMTDEAAKSLCFVDGCEVCAPLLAKAKLKASQRRKLPKSSFAIPEKAPAPGSYPINDKNHAGNALARSSGKPEEARVRAAVGRKFPGLKKSPGVPDYATQTPQEGGHDRSMGVSGFREPMTDGTIHPYEDPSYSGAGQSPYVIPAEAAIDPRNPHRSDTGHPDVPNRIGRPHEGSELTKNEAFAITHLFAALQREQLRKDAGGFLSVDNADAASTPGSPAWESYDSATLSDIASTLASCGKAIDAIMRREAIEAAAGDVGDIQDTWDLSMAGDALDNALSIVARLSFHEGASKSDEGAEKADLVSARNRLTAVFGDENINQAEHNGSAKKETITVETTPAELGNAIATAVNKAMDTRDKAAKKAAKKEAKTARKNANNGGDITEATLRGGVTGRTDADDVNSVGNGVVKGDKSLKKQVKELSKRLEKVAAQPVTGGPVLDGQPRGGITPSTVGQSGTLVKGADGHDYQVIKGADDHDYEIATPETIAALEKELETTLAQKGPEAMNRASQIGYQLTRAKLLRSHVLGEA